MKLVCVCVCMCWWETVTHPIAWSHHRLLLAAQFVEDVVGKLDAARPQLSCREQDKVKESVSLREQEGEGRQDVYVCASLDFYFERRQ